MTENYNSEEAGARKWINTGAWRLVQEFGDPNAGEEYRDPYGEWEQANASQQDVSGHAFEEASA